MRRTIVLGAGLSGLTAASHLRERSNEVRLVDKGRGVGGRLATRRIGDAVFDHGAQFFTTRGEDFKALVARAVDERVVVEWCRGFGTPDGYPRYRGAQGMTSVAKWLAAGHDIALGTEVDRIESDGDVVRFLGAAGEVVAAGDDAVVTAPIPQMLALFDRGGIVLPPDVDRALRTTNYFATLALLAVVRGPTAVAEPGGMQFDSGPFTFIADNARKGISPVTALTFHADHEYSRRRFDEPEADVHRELLELARPWLGAATVVESQLKKWRYAGPVTPLPFATHVLEIGACRIALAGDAFDGPKVEGAFASGLAAARAISRS